MIGCHIARRVALLTGWRTPRSSGVFGSALATKVLHLSCTSSRLGAPLRAVESPGGRAIAILMAGPAVEVQADGGEGGACRVAWQQAVRLTVLTLMSLATKGRESKVLA